MEMKEMNVDSMGGFRVRRGSENSLDKNQMTMRWLTNVEGSATVMRAIDREGVFEEIIGVCGR